jgi:hypothetical protein
MFTIPCRGRFETCPYTAILFMPQHSRNQISFTKAGRLLRKRPLAMTRTLSLMAYGRYSPGAYQAGGPAMTLAMPLMRYGTLSSMKKHVKKKYYPC